MSLLSVESLLKHLRTPSDGKFLFDDYLSDAWEIFQFDGEPDLASFEGFLIETVFQVFDEAEQNRENAKKRDACLVGLGLLEKCYHTKTNSSVPAHCDISTRCVNYLSGDYIKLSYPVPEEGANYNITDSRSLPRQALDQSARRARKQLSKRLTYMAAYGKESCQKCLQAGVENHTELITLSDGENERTIRRVVLPPPCYTLKNFPIPEQLPTPELQQDIHPEGTEDSRACGNHGAFSGQNTDLDENISGGTIESKLPDTSSCSTSNGSSGTSEDEKIKLSPPSPEISKSADGKTVLEDITSDEETARAGATGEHVPSASLTFKSILAPDIKPEGGSESTSESTQDSDPNTSTEHSQEHTPEFASNPTAMKSHTDVPSGGTSHPPKADTETSEPRTDEDNKPKRSFKPNIWAIIAGVLAMLLLAMMLLFAIYALNKSKNTNIDPVKAAEGGGIVNPNETNVEADTSMTVHSSSGTTIDINVPGIDKIASVSVIMTDSDGRAEQVTIKLDEVYDEVTAEQQDIATKDVPGGVDAYESDN